MEVDVYIQIYFSLKNDTLVHNEINQTITVQDKQKNNTVLPSVHFYR